MAEFTFQGKEAITKEVTKTGTGAHGYQLLPKIGTVDVYRPPIRGNDSFHPG